MRRRILLVAIALCAEELRAQQRDVDPTGLQGVASAVRVQVLPREMLKAPLQANALAYDVAVSVPLDPGIPIPTGTTITVTYVVEDESANEATDVTWDNGSQATAAFSLTAPMGMKSFTTQPLFLEQNIGDTPKSRAVFARVVLSTPLATGTSVTTPAVALPVPTIPIPTILVLFSQRWYGGHRLVIVGNASGLSAADDGLDVANNIYSLAAQLSALADAGITGLTWTRGELLKLPDRITGDATLYGLVVKRGDSFSNLNNIKLKSVFPLFDDPEAEDEIESIIMVGYSGREVRLYNKRSHKNGEGQLRLWTDHRFYVGVESLGPRSENDSDTDPNDLFNWEEEPKGGRWKGIFNPFHRIHSFRNEISSLRFAWH